MKKLFTTLAAALLVGISAFAQSNDSWFDDSDSDIYSSDVVKIGSGGIGLGFSQIISDDKYLDLEMGKSPSLFLDIIELDANLASEGHLKFHTALRWTIDTYSDKNKYLFKSSEVTAGTMAILPTVSNVKKSFMRIDYLGIPVGFKYSNNGVKLFANVLGEVRLSSISKVKYTDNTKNKESINGLEDLRASVECGIGYKDLAVFYRCSLTPTFKKTIPSIENDHIMTIGLILGI